MPRFKRNIRQLLLPGIMLLTMTLLGGCLLAERKTYQFTINPDGSGSGIITFFNLMSVEEESEDVSVKDFTDLKERYLKGTEFEDQRPGLTNVKKRLYEDNNVLCGELTFDFASYEDVGLYRFEGKGPFMYFTRPGDFNPEIYKYSNGTYGGESMPVVFWPEGTTTIRMESIFNKPERKATSLLGLYKRFGDD
ncbi:MAG: hypothetical protein IT211_08480 [Armatimonadetes bacterium]|nr:hypothetical protein [Armatimonadota bacterium]